MCGLKKLEISVSILLPAVASIKTYLSQQYINEQIHEDHNVSHRVRRKDMLSAEDLGILP
jgi:hypothetical protein